MLAPETVLQSRYRIVSKLSAGGMGTVYEAIDLRFNSQVALKETHFTEEALRKQFEREAHLLYKLRHPAIARVIDHFTEGEGQFLVMDFIEGEDLGEKLEHKGSAFPAEDVLKWGDQLLDALSYLHNQSPPVIHRDIKPQNLKLTDTGQIILLDFGLAKGFAGQISRVTTSGSIFGYTPNYAPLEQVHGTGTDPRSDLYSLAATMYKLLTNFTPADVSTRASAVIGGRPDTLKPASELNPQLTAAVSDVLRKGMAIDAEHRHSSAAEMRQALKDASQSDSFRDAETIIQRKPTRLPLRTVGIVIAWIGIGLVISYFIYTFINRSRSRTESSTNINPVTSNTPADTSVESIPASNSNQANTVVAPPSPAPSFTPMTNLEGTVWQGKRYWEDKEIEEKVEFKKDGIMTVTVSYSNNIFPTKTDNGTWTKQGDKVSMTMTDSIMQGKSTREGIIQGNEMKVYFNSGTRSFLVYRTK